MSDPEKITFGGHEVVLEDLSGPYVAPRSEFEFVAQDKGGRSAAMVHRIAVPGGWLYVTETWIPDAMRGTVLTLATTFVPVRAGQEK